MIVGTRKLTQKWISALLIFGAVVFGINMAQAQDLLEANAKNEGTLVWWTDWNIEAANAFKEQFEQQYPFIRVEIVRSDSAEKMTRLRAENVSGRNTVDVIDFTVINSTEAKELDMLLPYKSQHVEAYEKGAYDSDYTYYSYAATLEGICTNTRVVSNPVGRWEDLTNKEFHGKIGMQHLGKPGGSFGWFFEMQTILGKDTWEQYFQSFAAQDVVFAPGYMDAQQMLVRGEVGILPVCYFDFIKPDIVAGAPVVWNAPEPTLAISLTIQISKHAPHPNAAKLFVDYMLSETGQANVSTIVGKVPVRPGAPLPEGSEAATERTWYFTPTDDYREMNQDPDRRDEYFQTVRELFGLR